jgi:hypothetical protein
MGKDLEAKTGQTQGSGLEPPQADKSFRCHDDRRSTLLFKLY